LRLVANFCNTIMDARRFLIALNCRPVRLCCALPRLLRALLGQVDILPGDRSASCKFDLPAAKLRGPVSR